MKSHTILIVDDDDSVLASLGLVLRQAGYATRMAGTPQQAKTIVQQEQIDLVLQDLNFTRQTTGQEGLALLTEIKSHFPQLPVILITSWGTIELAVAGMQAGAADFITKPWSNQQLTQAVKTALGLADVKKDQKSTSRKELDERYDFSQIIGTDPALLQVLEMVGRVAATDASVLITGESGTGKELIADALHRNSPRSKNPFVKANMASIPASLFESELFGHVKGAFTDARTDRKGRFEEAHTGTLFLDEIGDLDLSCQVKLLRVLQERSFEAVGSSKTRQVDVRVISATNCHLPEMIRKGGFREDLFYRLNLIAIHLPPLRERPADIPVLARYFVQQAGAAYGKPNAAISENALKWLKGRPFPGNIRELKHMVERAVIMATRPVLEAEDFTVTSTQPNPQPTNGNLPQVGEMSLEELEKAMIQKAVSHYEGNLSKAAESLGMSRFALYRRLEKFGLHTT
jgi:two-component system NtrC family response regulator